MNYYNYFTEIEEHFVRRRGKHLYVSPLDWSLIATWRDSGVPLHVALRGIDMAMDSFFARQPHRASKVSTLFYCHASVMEEYARHLEAHVGQSPQAESGNEAPAPGGEQAVEPEGPGKEEILRFFETRIIEIKALGAKQYVSEEVREGIDRILGRLDEIMGGLAPEKQIDFESLDRDLAILDETLVGILRAAVTPEMTENWEKEARKDLKIYRKKLPPETYAKIVANYMRTRIHRHFAVGELSLFHM
ncbi:MAG: hypothetical protein H6Q05_3454 [Acidobacteria bacterium]|nr:hypothetical protein [Acidobacteriota bacterium]